MEQELKKRDDRLLEKLVVRVTAEKKKTVFALCLIAVMVLMWVRMLTSSAPKDSEAALFEQPLAEEQQEVQKICFIELPSVKGRNDTLARDFFVIDNEGFGITVEEVNIIPQQEDNEAIIRKIAGKLKLKAIVSGPEPEVFINDKLLSAGDRLIVVDEDGRYEFEVIGVRGNIVVIGYEHSEIKLRLPRDSVTN